MDSTLPVSFLLGLISSSIWQLAQPLFVRGESFPVGVGISLFCAGIGLLLVQFFLPFLSYLEPFTAPLLGMATFWLIFLSPYRGSRITLIAMGFWAFALGWLVLHVWAIPLALPALLLGLFGFSAQEKGEPLTLEQNPWKESMLGVLLGVLPGWGPGIMGLIWNDKQFSPFTGIANLVFSIGFVAISGKIRSAPAELFAQTPAEWSELFLLLLCGICIAWGIEQLFPALDYSIPLMGWTLLHLLAIVWLGNISTLLVTLTALAWFYAAREWNIHSSLGLLVLIPPIVWFYS